MRARMDEVDGEQIVGKTHTENRKGSVYLRVRDLSVMERIGGLKMML